MSPSSDWNQLHSRWWTRMVSVLGQVQHFERGQRRRLLARAHVGPDEARALGHLVGLGLDAVLEVLRRRHVRHVEAVAFDVELPAVIDAAQAAFLVAAEEQRGAAMRAAMLHDADAAVGVAEGDQLLAEQQEPHRLAVGLQLRRQAGGNPVFAHQVAHRRARADAREHLVGGGCEHDFLRFVRSADVRTIVAELVLEGESQAWPCRFAPGARRHHRDGSAQVQPMTAGLLRKSFASRSLLTAGRWRSA